MEFEERLAALATKVQNQREAIQTVEATKNAFVMPFISTILGRKPIARPWFNGKKQKYLGLFDENEVETKHPIETLDDIYLREATKRYAG